MEAIATLAQDDPWLKMTPEQRADEHRARRARFSATPTPEPIVVLPVIEAPPERKILLPIPNAEIAAAADFSFPRFHIDIIQRETIVEFPPVTLLDMKSPRRTALVVQARQVAMYLAKQMTVRSLPEIGRRFGGRDHTTVLHAVRRVTELRKIIPELDAKIERIKTVIAWKFSHD